jgi:hypothetical protein
MRRELPIIGKDRRRGGGSLAQLDGDGSGTVLSVN